MAKIHLAYDDSATPSVGDVFKYVGPDGVVEPATPSGGGGGGGTSDVEFIDDLKDVDTAATPPVDGDHLIWNDTEGKWLPGASSGGVRVEKNDTAVATRGGINFIEGSNVTLTVTDDAANDEVDVTIASSGSGGDVAVQDDDVEVVSAASTLNFGTGLDVTDDGSGKVTIDATGGGSGSSSLQWQDWTPVVKNGSTTVSYDASTSKAKYLKVGPVTFFWFYLAIDAAGTSGAITIEGQPTELQDVHALSARRHIGSLEFADTGTKHSSHRIYAQAATSWQIYEFDNFATNNTALASGDHLEGYGSIHTSDDAVDIGGGGSGSSWIPWTESDVVTEVKGERVTLTTGETQTLLDVTSDGVDFLGGHVIGSVGRLRITLDGTVVVDHITDGITGRGEDEAGDDIASFSIPAMQAESTLKIELNNMSGISRIYGWTLWHRPKTTGGGGGSGSSLTEEEVEDIVGAMVDPLDATPNTETLIAVTYDDPNGKLNFVVENDLSLYDNTTAGFYDQADVQGEIDTRVDKAFVDALNVDADTIDGLDSTDFASSTHSHTVGELSDATITSPDDNDILTFDSGSGEWINQTASEAGLSEAVHTHGAADIVSGSFDDARISQTSVTQHQAALTVTESQISDLNHYDSTDFNSDFTTKSINDLSDVDTSTTSPTDGGILVWENASSKWVPSTLDGGGHAETIGDGSSTSFTVTHNLGSKNLHISMWDLNTATPTLANLDIQSIELVDDNTAFITFGTAPATDSYQIVISEGGGGGGTDVEIQDDNVTVISTASTLNFGTNLDVTDDGSGKVTVDAASGGGGTTWLDSVASGNAPGATGDDEFDNDTIDAAFVTTTVSGSATWAEGNDVMSCLFQGQSAGDCSALLKSIPEGFAAGDGIETAVRIMASDNNYAIAGLAITDGSGTTANSVMASLTVQSGDNAVNLRSGSLTNIQASNLASGNRLIGPWLHIRLTWTAANTFQGFWSPDGVSWTDFGLGTQSKTITPSRIGLFVSTYGGAAIDRIATFEYLRII